MAIIEAPKAKENGWQNDKKNGKMQTQLAVKKALENIPGLAWTSTKLSEFDMRTDAITTPTLASLTAIVCTTLGDDFWQEDSTTFMFEEKIADLAGHESGIFCSSCTCANQLAIRALLEQPPSAMLCDAAAHIVNHEVGASAWISGAIPQLTSPSNGLYLTLDDIKEKAVLGSVYGSVLTRLIVLENTMGGIIVPLEEMQKICSWARQNGIRTHLDGARLWHAVAREGGPTVKDYCQLFDTVALDFSKVIGAPGGTMLVGRQKTIDVTRLLRKPMGSIGQLGVLAAAAEGAFMERIGLDHPNGNTTIHEVNQLSKRVGQMWTARGGVLVKPVETNIVWLEKWKKDASWTEFDARATDLGLKVDSPRLVFHHQISEEAIVRLGRLFDHFLK